MATAGIPHVLPGLQHAAQALASLARWSHATPGTPADPR